MYPVEASRGRGVRLEWLAAAQSVAILFRVALLNVTPEPLMVDARGRPYFLWDLDMGLAEFKQTLVDEDPVVRGYMLGKLMRQAKPDDVFVFVSPRHVRENWEFLKAHLGKSLPFWEWLFGEWERDGRGWE